MGVDGIARPRGRRAHVDAPAATTPPVTTDVVATASVPTATAARVPSAVDGMAHEAFFTAHDALYRGGVSSAHGPTKTAVPQLLGDWRSSLHAAAAEIAAQGEHEPAVQRALQDAEQHKGAPLSRREARHVRDDVYDAHSNEIATAQQAYLAEFTRDARSKARVESDVLLAERPRIAQLKDPFSAVAQRQPGARDDEIVLWENRNVMVVVDTFAPSPKALVVPKSPVSVPVDAPAGMLDELALVAAHTSDAFMTTTGTPPAGIWINPPQWLTVKQLHVHVMPDIARYTNDEAPLKALLEDAQMRPQVEAYFATIAQQLHAQLGPPSP